MIKITEKLYRGSRPHDIRDLIADGFQQVINLQSGAEDFWTDSLYEAQLLSKRSDHTLYPQIKVVYIRCPDLTPPSPIQVSAFLSAASNGLKTLAHCHSGVDRTGFMVAVYRMAKMGESFDDAYDDWVDQGRHWWYDWWKFQMKIYSSIFKE